MRISVAADELTGVAQTVVEELRRRGHEPVLHGALSESERDDWAWSSEAAARDVAEGRADQGAETARGARKWNDANVLALSLRTTSDAELEEILDAWFEGSPSEDGDDVANIRHVGEIA
jgi:ribose 5-phosphate isomerase B